MFPSFIGILDIQSWWEVPSIAYFCSLFRTAFNLLDFDIEELEEALLTDGTEESASSLLTELIVRLLNGCLGNNDISAFNYQMYLRRLFRRKCQDTGRFNPFDSDIDFQFLPLRTKVEILYALCDFRLDADDVFDLFKNLEAESLRVEPLGWDDNESAYWYFYGTRLYREDIVKKPKGKVKKKKNKKGNWLYGDDWLDDNSTDRVWQVVCFTEEDWTHLTEKFSKATSKAEKELFRSLSQNFLPEIPRLFQEKERLQRKRLLELAPRRTSSRVLQKIKQKEEEDDKSNTHETREEEEETKETAHVARENRAKRRNLLRSKSVSSESSKSSESDNTEMPLKTSASSKSQERRSKNPSASQTGEPPPDPPVKTGRKTNNSLASATGQILIPDNDEPVNSTRKKLKTSQIFSQTEEDIQIDMYKVLEQLAAHDDAWPFMDPVEEEYAPNYYAVIRRPMDLRKMEERLDSGYYTDFSMFKADFKLIVNNCRLYNGQDNEYTMMVDNLQTAFDRLTEKYMDRHSSSDEEIAVEYQIATPSRKHKLKTSESPSRNKSKKRKPSESEKLKLGSSDQQEEDIQEETAEVDVKKTKETHKSTQGKTKKKRKGHHRHGKHSKNHKKSSHKSEQSESKSKHNKKQKHGKNKESKKYKQKKKKNKHQEPVEVAEPIKRSSSQESLESSNRSRSASPLPSIHTPSPSPTEAEPPKEPQDDLFKDKYDKIKERRRHAAKDAWESLFDSKNKRKQNLNLPEKDKNQKLKETIERLRAKNEKYKGNSPFNGLFAGGCSTDKNLDSTDKETKKDVEAESTDFVNEENVKGKSGKTGQRKTTAKNESASEALEQAVKDISKWLDDAPKESAASSPCDSPARTVSTEEYDNSRLDDEFSQGERSVNSRKELSRKRPPSREPKVLVKRREIQRTIERLQPGKSKGNLLTNISNKNSEKSEEVAPLSRARDIAKNKESSPKLSLGSVLPTVEFALDKDNKFSNSEAKVDDEKYSLKNTTEENDAEKEVIVEKKVEPKIQPIKKDVEIETEPMTTISKPSQEKATPNLSAWFKAFGTPKSTTSTPSVTKKKVEDVETYDKPAENTNNDNKSVSPKSSTKYDSPTDPGTPNPDGGESPVPNASATPRQRRTSTGSSVSERSSFSQDLDSPRHQMSHTSPLLRSPASPRTEDFQKITYPIINGTIRAGFYQDTTSIKSSPEKSCSPREASQSPYSPYSQHVYASNNVTGSTTPNYFADYNKSPLPSYAQNPPPYNDTSKLSAGSKPPRSNEEYTCLGPETYQQNPYSPSHTVYPQTQPSNYSNSQNFLQAEALETEPTNNPVQFVPETKTTLFPVKKRTYNEPDLLSSQKSMETKEGFSVKGDFQKFTQSLHSVSSLSSSSVNNIALALSEKSEMIKLKNLRQKTNEDSDLQITENRSSSIFDSISVHEAKKDSDPKLNQPICIMKKDNVDMVNMGYMNPEIDRRSSNEKHDGDFVLAKDPYRSNANTHQSKDYEVDIKVDMDNQQIQNAVSKASILSNIPPAHSHDRLLSNSINTTHHQYDPMTTQNVTNFSLNDVELANKKLYTGNVSSSTGVHERGNCKLGTQIRKSDMPPSDYSKAYQANSDKLKSDMNVANATAINYNKIQPPPYSNYNVPRSNVNQTATRAQDSQHNVSSELRIPNPRGQHKSDLNYTATSIGDSSLIAKNLDAHAKSQKSDKFVQNHPLIGSMQYKTPYSTHSSIPLESLRKLPNIPHMLERYTNDERYLASFGSGCAPLYHDKFQMAQIFNKTLQPDVHVTGAPASIYSQSATAMSKDSSNYKPPPSHQPSQLDNKPKTKRKRTSDAKQMTTSGGQCYLPSSCNTDVLSSVKSNMMPGSAFSFGSPANMSLGGGLYGDNNSYSIEDFRNSTTNQLMAANYMAVAVAHQQRNSEANVEKIVKPAHQNSTHTSTTFPFMSHPQVRAGYPFVSADPSSPLYQQYLQHQEELLRQTGAQIIGLYPPGYPANLQVGVRQPYEAVSRPSWL